MAVKIKTSTKASDNNNTQADNSQEIKDMKKEYQRFTGANDWTIKNMTEDNVREKLSKIKEKIGGGPITYYVNNPHEYGIISFTVSAPITEDGIVRAADGGLYNFSDPGYSNGAFFVRIDGKAGVFVEASSSSFVPGFDADDDD